MTMTNDPSVKTLSHNIQGLTSEIYLLVLLCSILIVIFLFRCFSVIAIYMMKKRKAKSKQRQRQMEKTYKRRIKKHLKLEKAKLEKAKQAKQARVTGGKTDKSDKEKTTETTTTKLASKSTSQKASLLHKSGTPFSKTIMRVRPGLKDDDVVEKTIHVQFKNVAERPPRNSAAEYRFVEARWVEPPEGNRETTDSNTNSVTSHASRVAGSNSFGTPISSFSNESVSTLKPSSHSSLDIVLQTSTSPTLQQQSLVPDTPRTAIGTSSNTNFTMNTINSLTSFKPPAQH